MLASPMLWRDFVLPLPLQWARTMLDRSQHLPLSISCSHQALPPPQGSPAWQLPFDTLEHVRSIQMSRSAFNGNTTDISRLLSTPAPALEVFSFINMSGYLPREALFANCAPRLRHLTIYGARLLPLSLFSPNLVNLVISHVFLKRPESLSEFIAALQRLSRIEMLTLVGCLHPFSSAPQAPAPSQLAKLPTLSCLTIEGTVPQCLGFLRHVQTPDTIVLHVAAHKQGGVNDFTALFPFLTQGSAEDSFRVVKFRSEGPGNLTIFARHNDADYAPWDRNFEFEWGDFGDTVRDFMLVLCAEAGMRHCLSLSIELEDDDPPSETPFRPDEWMDILGAATELQTLQTSGGVGIMLCPTLSATVEDGTYSRTAAGSLVWPQLHILKLNYVNFSYRYQAGDGSSWAECTGMRADEVLLRELEHRRQRGAVLEELHLGSCTVDAQWMYKVADVVGRLSADNLQEDL
ncbi:hypothetical protein FA95DRAFT_1564013 [Auriscalpium vulgare]|uniref:Uncharacterized protein n=1 Tax=Auriscalpium vulgare TaxID=40419 RepID=A0ACB8RFD0_9AGAM|nr:hypothetical protein FA95DRAFT_1564013 [Auriscalpium vulgare]